MVKHLFKVSKKYNLMIYIYFLTSVIYDFFAFLLDKNGYLKLM
jgi:hypothetical protein